MKKFVLVSSLFATILLLSLTDPFNLLRQYRDPVPPQQKVAHSSHCRGCHGVDEKGLAIVDKDGRDVSIYDDWQISMMGFAAKDPFWRATVVDEVNHYPAAQNDIESTCLKCHAPLGNYQAQLDGHAYTYADMLSDSLGLDGVSCNACHQQSPENPGQFFSGNYILDTNRVVFGHLPNPFKGPMQIYVDFEPEYSEHIYNSETCAGCHTLITETLTPEGTPSGEHFVEQATYHEWLNSIYPNQGKECQTCHMPFLQEGVIIATDLASLEPRQPYGLHQIHGANTAMLTILQENQKELGLPTGESDHAWSESIETNRRSLSMSGVIEITSQAVIGDTFYLSLSITNKAGHKLPSGYPSRLAWLQVELTDATTQETFYLNGALGDDGVIEGRDHPFEPHHEVSYSAEDVQIYEMVMSDLTGHLTTRLNAAYQPLKDNRLLPTGFKTDHSAIDTVAIFGKAIDDPDYSDNSANGQDRIEYRIPLTGAPALANLKVSLRYQTLPSRWMRELFTSDTLETVAQFKSMYAGYENFYEVIDSIQMDSLDLSTTGIAQTEFKARFNLYPNPIRGDLLHVDLRDGISLGELTYRITSASGMLVQTGKVTNQITLSSNVAAGVFYLMLYEQNKLVGIKPFIRL